MKAKALPLVAGILIALLSAGRAFAADAAAKPAPRVTPVIISADAAPSAEGFRPRPDKPVVYFLKQMQQGLGGIVGGIKIPSPAQVEKSVVAELTKQGFSRVVEGGPPPDIVILAVVGDANFAKFEQPGLNPPEKSNLEQAMSDHEDTLTGAYDASSSSSAAAVSPSSSFGRTNDKGTLMSMVGANKLIRALGDDKITDNQAAAFATAINKDLYFVALVAFDARHFQKTKMVPLWRTVMVIDYHEGFIQSLNAMLAQAGPVFGTDLPLPVAVDERHPLRPEVEIGEMKVLPDDSAPKVETKK